MVFILAFIFVNVYYVVPMLKEWANNRKNNTQPELDVNINVNMENQLHIGEDITQDNVRVDFFINGCWAKPSTL